jgi:hypothetical protein
VAVFDFFQFEKSAKDFPYEMSEHLRNMQTAGKMWLNGNKLPNLENCT